MLKLYTNTQFLSERYRRKVFPLLFDLFFLQNAMLKSYYILVDSIAECDIVVFPIDYIHFLQQKSDFKALNSEARKYKKPIWTYTSGDYGFTNYIANCYTFRLGGFDSKLNDYSFILPSFINDPYLTQISGGFSVLDKDEKPSIGFVGHAQSGILKYIKEMINHFKFYIKKTLKKELIDAQHFYPSSVKRFQYLSMLAKDEALKTEFILRTKYRAGIKSEQEKQQSTKVFYENIFNNAYTFCSRGVGNFSVRFYETLAMGRIPILLNTDCRLPLETEIDWKQHCVIIEESQISRMYKIILEFHNSKSEIEFKDIQKNNRTLWETKLNRAHYFAHIHNLFITKTEKVNG